MFPEFPESVFPVFKIIQSNTAFCLEKALAIFASSQLKEMLEVQK